MPHHNVWMWCRIPYHSTPSNNAHSTNPILNWLDWLTSQQNGCYCLMAVPISITKSIFLIAKLETKFNLDFVYNLVMHVLNGRSYNWLIHQVASYKEANISFCFYAALDQKNANSKEQKTSGVKEKNECHFCSKKLNNISTKSDSNSSKKEHRSKSLDSSQEGKDPDYVRPSSGYCSFCKNPVCSDCTVHSTLLAKVNNSICRLHWWWAIV